LYKVKNYRDTIGFILGTDQGYHGNNCELILEWLGILNRSRYNLDLRIKLMLQAW